MSPRGKMRALLGVAVLVAVGVAAYLPALGGGFVFDDHELIENGRLLRGPLSAIWLGTTSPDYWPLTYSTLWLEWRLFGSGPAGYHAVNVALHLATALLLWRTLGRLGVSGGWLAGLLFAVHPAAVESVAWVSEIKNTLSGVLWAATILAWLWFERERSSRARAVALGLFALALLAKASVVVLPVVLLGVALARRGRIEKRDLVDLAPFLLLAIVAGAGTVWFQHHNAMSSGTLPPRGLGERVGGAGWALASYLETAYFPVRLALLYPPWPVGPGTPLFWVPLLTLAAAGGILWRFRAGRVRPLVIALGYHAACVAPVVGLVDMAFFQLAPVSNHLQYLALMGPASLAGWALSRLGSRSLALAGVASAVAVTALGAFTFMRAAAFHDDLTLWQAAVREAPTSAVARQELGHQLVFAGRAAEGIAELEQAAALFRDPASRHGIRSEILLLQGRAADAAAEAQLVIESTKVPRLLSDAAWTLVEANRAEEAVPVLASLVHRMPASSEYAYRLSVALARSGRTADALEVLLRYCRSQPGHPRMEPALALLLVRAGRVQEARERAAAVLGVGAGDPRADALLRTWYAEATGGAGLPGGR